MFTQSVCSPSYSVVKSCKFDLVNDVIVDTRRSVSVCHKVCMSILTSVSANVFHACIPVMSLHVRNVLMSPKTIYHIPKVNPCIPLSVNTSTKHVNHVSHKLRHVQCPTYDFQV